MVPNGANGAGWFSSIGLRESDNVGKQYLFFFEHVRLEIGAQTYQTAHLLYVAQDDSRRERKLLSLTMTQAGSFPVW